MPCFQEALAQPQPWWKIQLFVWEPVLFGTWDGVFTSCLINIFGVVLFLRTGWLVVSGELVSPGASSGPGTWKALSPLGIPQSAQQNPKAQILQRQETRSSTWSS